MKSVFAIEDIWYAEAHDDYCSDYSGEVASILGNEFFSSFEEAWKYVIETMEKYHKNDYTINDDNRSVDFNFGDTKTYRVIELTKHRNEK